MVVGATVLKPMMDGCGCGDGIGGSGNGGTKHNGGGSLDDYGDEVGKG